MPVSAAGSPIKSVACFPTSLETTRSFASRTCDKRKRAGRTVTGVHRLERAARIEEIARMAGGATVSDATRRHAQELLRSRRR
jgi:hypothetical protein